MCNFVCSIITTVAGSVLVVASCLIGFILVPSLVENIITSEVVLIDDTVQYERFEAVPFPLRFSATVMQISNPEEVLAGGVPVITEVGPYVYKLYQTRNITYAEDDIMRYTRLEEFEFDAEASYPYTEDDMVTTINVIYHAIIQIAEQQFPLLMPALSMAMGSVFGVHNSPISTYRVRDLFFDGVRLCENPGIIVGPIACALIKEIGASAQNLEEREDGSLWFSLLNYKNLKPSPEYEIHRGFEDPAQLGLIRLFDSLPHFMYWMDDAEGDPGVCNMVNGTDSGIYAPFVDREKSLYAINTDICRSVELRYQYDVDVDGIPAYRFAINEWFLDNNEGCFCLNVTQGITRDDGCLLTGALELYTCVGAMLVLTYPHYLYADATYRNGVVGMTPNEESHRIFMDIEPNTGSPLRGAKRAQFNIFQRPISGISASANLRTVLMPIVWIEESVDIPDELKYEIRTRLLRPLDLLTVVIPVLIAACCAVTLLGLVFVWRARRASSESNPILETNNKQ